LQTDKTLFSNKYFHSSITDCRNLTGEVKMSCSSGVVMVSIWPFLRQFVRNEMICPFGPFGLFLMLNKIVYFRAIDEMEFGKI